jgi:rhomboid protease GluP
MPEKSQTLTVAGQNAPSLLALAYGTCEKLGWNIKYAGENILVAYTPRNGFRWDMEITIRTADDQITVTSKMIHNESFDIMGRNKKNIDLFTGTFQSVRSSASAEQIQTWNEKIEILKQDTVKAAEEEVKQAAEVDQVMNFSKANLYATYAIIGINVLVFVAMVATGLNLFAPNPIDVLRWGGNLSVLTLSGDWWRLLTAMFLHFGILHLGLNMYALFMVGVYLEPMLGKLRYITAYLCTGLIASLVSTIWLKDKLIPAAGASGAVFGMYGVFLALLTTNIIPKQLRNAMLQSTLIFVAYNVFYGFKPGSGIDNAAHLGGLISGFIIGYVYWLTIKPGEKKLTPNLASILIAVLTGGLIYFFLQQEKVNASETATVRMELKNSGYTDSQKFSTSYNEFVELQDKALALLNDTTVTAEEFKNTAQKVSYPSWAKAESLLLEMEKMDVSENNHQKVKLLKRYVELRKQELQVREEMITAPADDQTKKLEDIIVSINGTMDDFKKLQSPESN